MNGHKYYNSVTEDNRRMVTMIHTNSKQQLLQNLKSDQFVQNNNF